MNERIKLIRRNAGLTQERFAKVLGTVQNTITGYETGNRKPSGSVITLICKEFNINEEWLRTGHGEMYRYPDLDTGLKSMLSDLAAHDIGIRQLIANYYKLDGKEKESLWNLIRKLTEKPEDEL